MTERHRQREKQGERQRETETDEDRERHGHRQTDRQAQTEIETDRDGDRQTDPHTHTEAERERDRQRQRQRQRQRAHADIYLQGCQLQSVKCAIMLAVCSQQHSQEFMLLQVACACIMMHGAQRRARTDACMHAARGCARAACTHSERGRVYMQACAAALRAKRALMRWHFAA